MIVMVISMVGDVVLSVSDFGYLVNGTFLLFELL